MKRIRLIGTVVIIIIFSLMALGSFDSKDDSDKKEITTSSNDEPSSDNSDLKKETPQNDTENVKNDKKEKTDVKIEKTVVYDAHDIKITAEEYTTDSILGEGIKFLLENNSKKSVSISTEAVIVNNYMISDMFYETVAAGKKAYETMNLLSSDMKAAGITNVGQIEVYFHIYDSDTYKTIDDSECILIKTNLYDKMDTTVDNTGKTLYEKDGIKIIGKYVDESSFWGAAVMLYCENNSGQKVRISVDDLSVNGFMVSSFFSQTVYDGKMAFDDITLL
jgi:hypothetical protein